MKRGGPHVNFTCRFPEQTLLDITRLADAMDTSKNFRDPVGARTGGSGKGWPTWRRSTAAAARSSWMTLPLQRRLA